MAEKLISINIMVADRPYRLKIKPAEEENVRKAAKMINDKIREYQNTYEAKDRQDYLAMYALSNSVELLNISASSDMDQKEVDQKLSDLNDILSGFLEK